jgi:hypothetical protein
MSPLREANLELIFPEPITSGRLRLYALFLVVQGLWLSGAQAVDRQACPVELVGQRSVTKAGNRLAA